MMQWVENNEKNNSCQSNLILPGGSEEGEGWGSFSTITMHNIDNGKQNNNNLKKKNPAL